MTTSKKENQASTPDPNVYLMKQEFKVDDKIIKTVTVKRLTGADMLAIEQEVQAFDSAMVAAAQATGKDPGMLQAVRDYSTIGQAERIMRLIGKACGLKYEDVQLMDAADINSLSDRVNGFLF